MQKSKVIFCQIGDFFVDYVNVLCVRVGQLQSSEKENKQKEDEGEVIQIFEGQRGDKVVNMVFDVGVDLECLIDKRCYGFRGCILDCVEVLC